MDLAAGDLPLSAGAQAQTRLKLAGREVDAARMRANLDLTAGMIVSEAVMMGLGPHLGRQRAHDLVYEICRKVASTGTPLVELLARDAEISRHLTRSQLEELCDPGRYLGLAGEMVDRVLAREDVFSGRRAAKR
jgi:3-carboxy-cis,cis-muconate cycloisomerase